MPTAKARDTMRPKHLKVLKPSQFLRRTSPAKKVFPNLNMGDPVGTILLRAHVYKILRRLSYANIIMYHSFMVTTM